jgi:hypothetical protein
MGLWADFGMRFFIGDFDLSSVSDYIYTNCYKVMACDANDQIIND